MAWFADDRRLGATTQNPEEAVGSARIIGETWRQLHQHDLEAISQSGTFVEKLRDQILASFQAKLMGHCLRQLDGEAKIRGDGCAPTFIGLRSMRTVERGVYFNRIYDPIAGKMGTFGNEGVSMSGRNTPARGADEGPHLAPF